MKTRQYKNQYSGFCRDTAEHIRYIFYMFPVAELNNCITYIKQIVTCQQQIVCSVGNVFTVLKERQYKYPSIAVKQPADPYNNVTSNKGINRIGKDIIVHSYIINLINLTKSSPRLVLNILLAIVSNWSVRTCISFTV